MKYRHLLLGTLILWLLIPSVLQAKNWKYIKDLDGVKLYSGQEANQKYKSFKGIAQVNMSSEKIFSKLENINQIDWWTKDATHIEVFTYKKNRLAQYYLVYQLPWPFRNRDLYVHSEAEINYSTNEYRLVVVPLKGSRVIENNKYVRINDFRQDWKISTINKNKTQIEFEYYIDVGTNLPTWLINQILADSPAKIIKSLIE